MLDIGVVLLQKVYTLYCKKFTDFTGNFHGPNLLSSNITPSPKVGVARIFTCNNMAVSLQICSIIISDIIVNV